MRTIKAMIYSQPVKGKTLYTYLVVDEVGNEEEIDSLQQFKIGDRVETWFDGQYNKPKMRLYKKTRK